MTTGAVGELAVVHPDGRRRGLRRAITLDSPARYILTVALLVGLYYGAAHLGYALSFSGAVASIVWLPVGVGIAFLYIAGPQFWPGVVIGDLLVNDYSTLPIGSAVGQTVGNVLEVLVAAALMRRLIGRRAQLESISEVSRMAVALAAGTAVSAIIGPTVAWLGHVLSAHSLPGVARTWWLGDFCGALIVVPLVLAWSASPWRALARRHWIEVVMPLLSVIVVGGLVFRGSDPLSYVMFPVLIWSALRLGQQGATLAVAIAAAFAVWATTSYVGPFHFHSLTRSVLETQLFIAVASLSTLSLAAAVCERERFAEGLWVSRLRMVEAVDTERRRLEHNLHDGAQMRLTALLIRIGLIEDGRDAPEPVRDLVSRVRSELTLVIDDLRQISHGKHPRVLTERGLGPAIESLVRDAPIPIELQDLPACRLDEACEATGYYVISEALANAERHARASMISVRAHVADHVLEVEITDDGVGGATETDGHGLQGLRDRVETLGGTFTVASPQRVGTRISSRIPIGAGAHIVAT